VKDVAGAVDEDLQPPEQPVVALTGFGIADRHVVEASVHVEIN
jgi:hypothetical protein